MCIDNVKLCECSAVQNTNQSEQALRTIDFDPVANAAQDF